MILSFRITLLLITGMSCSLSFAQLDNPTDTSHEGHRIGREHHVGKSHSFESGRINKAPTFVNSSKRMLGAPDDMSLDSSVKDDKVDITVNGDSIQSTST